MSKYRFGCGEIIEIDVPRGFDYVTIERECGSTAHHGGINQCWVCEQKYTYTMPDEDESDSDWYERNYC